MYSGKERQKSGLEQKGIPDIYPHPDGNIIQKVRLGCVSSLNLLDGDSRLLQGQESELSLGRVLRGSDLGDV